MWLLIQAGLKLNQISKGGPRTCMYNHDQKKSQHRVPILWDCINQLSAAVI